MYANLAFSRCCLVKLQQVAITALCPLLGGSGLLCVGSADACLTLYDIATQVRFCRCIDGDRSVWVESQCFFT